MATTIQLPVAGVVIACSWSYGTMSSMVRNSVSTGCTNSTIGFQSAWKDSMRRSIWARSRCKAQVIVAPLKLAVDSSSEFVIATISLRLGLLTSLPFPWSLHPKLHPHLPWSLRRKLYPYHRGDPASPALCLPLLQHAVWRVAGLS